MDKTLESTLKSSINTMLPTCDDKGVFTMMMTTHTGNTSSLQCQEVGRRKGAKELVVIINQYPPKSLISCLESRVALTFCIKLNHAYGHSLISGVTGETVKPIFQSWEDSLGKFLDDSQYSFTLEPNVNHGYTVTSSNCCDKGSRYGCCSSFFID
jgi:hypothetical protein